MKFSNIVKAVKGRGKIKIFSSKKSKTEQWLSDNFAAYVLENMPRFSSENFPAAANLNWDSDRVEEHPFPDGICFADNDESENPIERSPILLDGYIPFFTRDNLMFIDSEYMKPFKGEIPQELFFYERVSADGQLYIAVKRGLILIAVILPVRPDSIIESHKENVNKLFEAMTVYKVREIAARYGIAPDDAEESADK